MDDQPNKDHIKRLTQDLKAATATLSDLEARFLVDAYYIIQEDRKRSGNQIKAMKDEPHLLLTWFFEQNEMLELQLKNALDRYSDSKPVGVWMKSQYGIGPVIAAGLLAHIDINKAPTVGHIWSFAGLDNAATWLGSKKAGDVIKAIVGAEKKIGRDDIIKIAEALDGCPKWLCRRVMRASTGEDIPHKGISESLSDEKYLEAFMGDKQVTMKDVVISLSKRPWNASLKTLCWHIGQSFMKFSNRDQCFYGKLYKERKAYELARNDSGGNAELAKVLAPKFNKSTEAYGHLTGGKLPPAQIDARARRWVVKLFLSHMHQRWYELELKKDPPKPFALGILHHGHFIPPPS